MIACPSCGRANIEGATSCVECSAGLESNSASRAPAREIRELRDGPVRRRGRARTSARRDAGSRRSSARVMTRYFAVIQRVYRGSRRDGREVHRRRSHGGVRDSGSSTKTTPCGRSARPLRSGPSSRRLDAEVEGERAESSTRLPDRDQTRGQVVAGDTTTGQTLRAGDTINTAARLETAAAPGVFPRPPPHGKLVRDAVHGRGRSSRSWPRARHAPLRALPPHRGQNPAVAGHARRASTLRWSGASPSSRLSATAYRGTWCTRAGVPARHIASAAPDVGKSRLVAGVHGPRSRSKRRSCVAAALSYGEKASPTGRSARSSAPGPAHRGSRHRDGAPRQDEDPCPVRGPARGRRGACRRASPSGRSASPTDGAPLRTRSPGRCGRVLEQVARVRARWS